MNKIAHYLQEHLSGEVITSHDVRNAPRSCWQLAERGQVTSIKA